MSAIASICPSCRSIIKGKVCLVCGLVVVTLQEEKDDKADPTFTGRKIRRVNNQQQYTITEAAQSILRKKQ